VIVLEKKKGGGGDTIVNNLAWVGHCIDFEQFGTPVMSEDMDDGEDVELHDEEDDQDYGVEEEPEEEEHLEDDADQEEEEEDRRGIHSVRKRTSKASKRRVYQPPAEEEEDADEDMLALTTTADEYLKFVQFAIEEKLGKVLWRLAQVKRNLPDLIENLQNEQNFVNVIDSAISKWRMNDKLIPVFGEYLKAVIFMSLEEYEKAFIILFKITK
jgi:hypothetical protein